MGSSDEDDDRPLGASLAARRLHGDGSDGGSDVASADSRRRHRRKRPVEESSEGGGRKRAREEPLFADSGKSGMDRRLERAVADITLDMLEGVRLGQARLLHILEHPRAEDFIIGAYVRHPDLEKVEADAIAPEDAPLLPAQITKIVPLETPEKIHTDAGPSTVSHQLTIVQYTQRFDRSLKIRKAKLNIAHVNNEPFEMRELEQWRELLKLFSGRAGAEKLQSLPQMLPETAERLKSFTFTDEDVNAILQRRMEQQEGLAKLSAGPTLNWRDLYLKKAELEFQIQELQVLLDGAPEMAEDTVADASAKLDSAQLELAQVKQNLEILRKEESSKKEPAKLDQEPGPMMPAAVTRTARSRTAASTADVSMLTPRFLQTKSTGGAAGRVMDWRSLEGAHHFTKLAWSNPNVRPDGLYKPAHATSMDEWKKLKRKLADRLRSATTVESLALQAQEVVRRNIDFEQNVRHSTLANLNNLFRLPFAAPAIKGDREIVNIVTKSEE